MNELRMASSTTLERKVSVDRRRAATDPLTRRALARVREAPPQERLLALAGCTVSELATRLVPEVSRSRLRAVLEQAEHGRMSRDWAERLGRVVDASADDVLALFAIDAPAVRGRPRRHLIRVTRRSA
jgi:plasmid maintenance system antidote protein VapI